MTQPNLDTPPLPDELEWGTTQYLNNELAGLLSDYGLEHLLNELSNLCHEKALHLALEYNDYRAQVTWNQYGDYLSGLSYLMFTAPRSTRP